MMNYRKLTSSLPSLGALAFLAVLAGGLWAFIELSDEVLDGSTHAVDGAILEALRVSGDLSDPIGPVWFEEMMRDFTGLGSLGVLILATLSVCGFMWLAGAPRAALAVLIAIASGLLLSTLLKIGFDRPRPDLVPHGAKILTASFPSGHSMMSAVVYLTLGALVARIVSGTRLRLYVIAVAVLVTILVGVSRIYLGVHWPTDVLAGWLLGSLWAIISSTIVLRLQVRHKVEQTED